MESRIIEFGLDFAEKSKIEVERNLGMEKSRFKVKFDEIKL